MTCYLCGAETSGIIYLHVGGRGDVAYGICRDGEGCQMTADDLAAFEGAVDEPVRVPATTAPPRWEREVKQALSAGWLR